MSQDLSSKCRTCLSELNFYYQLFDYVEGNYKIIEMLEDIVPQIDMKTSSQFSTLVCQMCVDKLLTAYKFQQLCIETNTRLHDLLGIAMLETKPKLEMCYPFTGEPTVKMEEIEEDVYFEIETLPDELDEGVRSDNSRWVPDNGTGSDTDPGNEKLSVLKERSAKEISLEIEKPENPLKLKRRKGYFPCTKCGKEYTSLYNLERHINIHHEIQCPDCIQCFETKRSFSAHYAMHKRQKLLENKRTNSEPESFNCPDCPKRFEKQASLSAHRQTHTRNTSRFLTEHITKNYPEAEKYKCDQCEKIFVLHAHLDEHLNHHKSNTNLTCKKKFEHNKTLKEHVRTDSSESTYLCPQCGKTFGDESSFRQHMKRHTGFKKYQCTECPIRFYKKSDLIKHAATHSNSKPYVCDICGIRFTRPFSLKMHKRLHSGERPFKCDQCNMTFTRMSSLQRHIRTHTGEKPYKCKYCDRSFFAGGDLTKHFRTHFGENIYMCDQCPMKFKYKAEFRQHKSHHYKMAQTLLQQSQKLSEDTEHEITEQEIQNLQQEKEFQIQEQQQTNQP